MQVPEGFAGWPVIRQWAFSAGMQLRIEEHQRKIDELEALQTELMRALDGVPI